MTLLYVSAIGFVVVSILALMLSNPRQQAILKILFWSLFCIVFGAVMAMALLQVVIRG